MLILTLSKSHVRLFIRCLSRVQLLGQSRCVSSLLPIRWILVHPIESWLSCIAALSIFQWGNCARYSTDFSWGVSLLREPVIGIRVAMTNRVSMLTGIAVIGGVMTSTWLVILNSNLASPIRIVVFIVSSSPGGLRCYFLIQDLFFRVFMSLESVVLPLGWRGNFSGLSEICLSFWYLW